MCCMSSVMPAHEPAIRLTVFVVILIAMAVWEAMAPRRLRLVSRWVRWPGNLGIVALNTVVLRAAFPVASVGLRGSGRGARLGPAEQRHLARSGGGYHRGPAARPCGVLAACDVPRGPGALASAPHAPHRSRLGRNHGCALPSARNSAVDGA